MIQNNILKEIIKSSLQTAAARLGPHARSARQSQLLVLMYHRILPANDERIKLEEPGMYVTPETFQKNIEILRPLFEFVKLSEWLDKRQKNLPLPAKACAITFDDGWADNYEFAYPVLQKTGVPATIFIVSDMIGTNTRFWPERLAAIVTSISTEQPEKWSIPELKWLRCAKTDYKFLKFAPSREEITQLIAHAKQLPDQEINVRLDRIKSKLELKYTSRSPSLLSWSQIKEMIDSGLIDAGSHTCHHTRLNSQTPIEILTKEIVHSKRVIEQQLGKPITIFCFPNGDYSETALELVRRHYLAAVTTSKGWNSIKSNPYLLKRIGIHEDIAKNKTAFLARISGWLTL